MKNIVLCSLISFVFLSFFQVSLVGNGPANVYAQQDWKQEFAEVCSKTRDAMALSIEELKSFIEICDKLLARIDQPDGLQMETERKVYGKRLKMCRDLYDFALQQKIMKE